MDKLSESLNETLLSASTDDAIMSICDLSVDIAEVDIDALIGTDVFKELPIIKTLIAGYKTITSIRDYLFLQKIVRFLYQLKQTTLEERQIFLRNLKALNEERLFLI